MLGSAVVTLGHLRFIPMELIWESFKYFWSTSASWCQLSPQSLDCLPNLYDSSALTSARFPMTTDYFTTERPTNRLPCTKDESKITKCVNKGQCFAVVIKDQRHLACHCPEGFVGRHCEEKRIPYWDDGESLDSPLSRNIRFISDDSSESSFSSRSAQHVLHKRAVSYSDPSYINSASLLWGLLIVLAVLIFLILIGFVIWRKFFRNQPKSKPVVATAEYDHNKQLIAVKEFENRHYSRPNEESETEPLDHTLDMRDDTFEVTIGTSPNYNRPSPDESHMSAGFHSNGKVTNV